MEPFCFLLSNRKVLVGAVHFVRNTEQYFHSGSPYKDYNSDTFTSLLVWTRGQNGSFFACCLLLSQDDYWEVNASIFFTHPPILLLSIVPPPHQAAASRSFFHGIDLCISRPVFFRINFKTFFLKFYLQENTLKPDCMVSKLKNTTGDMPGSTAFAGSN